MQVLEKKNIVLLGVADFITELKAKMEGYDTVSEDSSIASLQVLLKIKAKVLRPVN